MPKNIEVQVGERKYHSMTDVAREFGCSISYIKSILLRTQDPEQVRKHLQTYKPVKKRIRVSGYQFESIKELITQTGINQKKLNRLLNRDWSIEERDAEIIQESVGFYLLGKRYWCKKECAERNGLREEDVQYLLDRYDYSQHKMEEEFKKLLKKKEGSH